VERRRDQRISPQQNAIVLVLGEEAGVSAPLHARIIDISERGMSFKTMEPLPVGAAVRIDLDDNLLLGEVCHCSAMEGGYLCGVELEHVLSRVADLARLVRGIMGDPNPLPDRVAIQESEAKVMTRAPVRARPRNAS
jgi:hypothetical protein